MHCHSIGLLGPQLQRISFVTSSLWTKLRKNPLSKASEGGLSHQSNDGKSIYYFGGYPHAKLVHKFNSETNITVALPTELPSSVINASCAFVKGRMFIFIGIGRVGLEFDLESETAKIISSLCFQRGVLPVYSTTAISVGQDGV
jgi:hypothetical protein